MTKTGVLYFLMLMPVLMYGQEKNDAFLIKLINKQASPLLKKVLQQPDTFHFQLIYTQINRDENNVPHFKHYYYRVNRNEYFNPASMVKLPTALLALEKLHGLQQYGVDKYSAMITDSAFSRQSRVLTDSTSANGWPSVAHYIKKIFLVSDNDAYNRLYEFVGQETLNRRLWQMGYTDTRITRRFVTMNEEENRHTNPVQFYNGKKLLYRQPAAYNQQPFDFSRKILVGNAHYNREDSLVFSPMDFTTHNNFPLEDMQQVLQSALFPASAPAEKRFGLTAGDYSFLYRYMSELPVESKFPQYDTSEFFDSYTKFFLFKAGRGKLPGYIRVFNKTGWSYGFLTDVAYIVDFKNKLEFMLSGVIYVNSDGVLNDDRYEYEQIGYPFFKETGNIIYQYELKRKRKYLPDLSAFQFDYTGE